MKKLIFLLLLIVVVICSLPVFAGSDGFTHNKEILVQYQVISEPYFSNLTSVTRYECLNALIKGAGATEEGAYGASAILFGSYGFYYYSDKAYHDGDGGVVTDENGNQVYSTAGKLLRKNDDGMNTTYGILDYTPKEVSCINLAFSYGIAQGEIHNGKRYFYFERAVTLSETLLFMMRLLESLDFNDPVLAMQKAEEYGIISQNDRFYHDPTALLTPEEYCEVLIRFLSLPRYYYFTDRTDDEIQTDETGSKTYLEYLAAPELYPLDD